MPDSSKWHTSYSSPSGSLTCEMGEIIKSNMAVGFLSHTQALTHYGSNL